MISIRKLCLMWGVAILSGGCAMKKPVPVSAMENPAPGISAPASVPAIPAPPAPTQAEAKLDAELRDLAKTARAGDTSAGAKRSADDGPKVKVEIIANSAGDVPGVMEKLKAAGGAVVSDLGNHVWANIPVSSIDGLSQLDIVWSMAVSKPTTSAK
jgi:hypothetical protein